MTRKQAAALTVLSLIVLALAFLVSRRFWFRLDFTGNKAYTISEVSRKLHNEIPDQVRITYYLSDKLRSMHPMPGEIEDLLREYAAYSRGKIRLMVKDPVKARLAEQVERLGIQPQQIQTVGEDQASLVTVYTGLAIEYLDAIEVLPVVFSLDTLEYDLTSRIRALVRGGERQIGIIVGDSFRRWNEDYVYLNQAFTGAGYRPRLIPPGDEIPDSLPALFVLGGVEGLDNRALYRIDRYIRQGGRVLFALEGIYVDTLGSLEARKQNDQGLLDMVASYGAIVRPELVLDRAALTLQYQTGSPGGGVQYRIVRYPHWIGVLPENGNPEHPVSARFGGVDLFWPSPLELHSPEGVEATPLFTSTGDAWVMRDPFYTNPDAAYLFERDAVQTRGLKILGASLTGIFPGWFAGTPRPVREGSDEELPDMPAMPRPSRIIVVGDTDFATTIISASGGRQNLDFLLQAADWLGNDDDIIGIRNRESQAGRLDRIIDPEKRSAAMRAVQLVNVILMPLAVIFAGLFLAWKRRARSRISAKEHSDDV
ncbi:MAG: GldG family protein [Treponema sp.]|nr:GldG family protein [Treponema sp.]